MPVDHQRRLLRYATLRNRRSLNAIKITLRHQLIPRPPRTGLIIRVLTCLHDRMRRYDLMSGGLPAQKGHRAKKIWPGNSSSTVKALAGADRPDDARAVWEYGLRCPDHAGNWSWKQQIAHLLNQTDA